jgi:hypothetical protein
MISWFSKNACKFNLYRYAEVAAEQELKNVKVELEEARAAAAASEENLQSLSEVGGCTSCGFSLPIALESA